MSSPDLDRHTLSQAENERIFQERVRPLVLPDDLQPSEQPTFVMLGGQPGAGKTGLLIAAREELGQQGTAVSVVGDDLRGFHPGYRGLQRSDPEQAAFATNPDAGRWVERLLEEAQKRRVNVVLETTMRQPDNVERIMQAFQEAGYRTEARVVAVNERESWQGVHLRYEAALAAGGPGAARFTLKAVHDAAAVGMLSALDRIENRGLADRVAVHRRSGEITYANERRDEIWREPARSADAVLEERERPTSPEDRQTFAQNWKRVVGQMQERDAPAPAIAGIERQAREDDRAINDRERGLAERQAAAEIVLIPARVVAPLSEAEIEGRLAASVELTDRHEHIARGTRTAFGEEGAKVAAALVAAAEGSPKMARAAATRLIAEPVRFGGLDGRGAGLLRNEDEARRVARVELPRLAQATEDYGTAVERERRTILEAHAREQQRQGQAVTVSQSLHATLTAPIAERDSRLGSSEALRDEASRLNKALHQRLSGAEQKAAVDRRTGALARALQVSPAEAKVLTAVHQRVREIANRPTVDRRREREVERILKRTL